MTKKKRKIEPDPVIEVYKKDLDLTLIKENLKLSPEHRFLKLMELNRLADELKAAGKKQRYTQKPNQHD